jgi:hypothetical protein
MTAGTNGSEEPADDASALWQAQAEAAAQSRPPANIPEKIRPREQERMTATPPVLPRGDQNESSEQPSSPRPTFSSRIAAEIPFRDTDISADFRTIRRGSLVAPLL